MRWTMITAAGALAAGLLASAALAQSPSPTGTVSPSVTSSPTATPTPPETPTPSATPADTSTPTIGPGSTTPVPTSTQPAPPPAPPDVKLRGEAILLDEDNFPLPPERQKHTNILTWGLVNGAYAYEVGRADLSNTDVILPFVVATIDASQPGAPPYRFEEPYPFLQVRQWCYQVRALRGEHTGPWSDPVCTERPPTTGPGDTVTPQPPPTGTGTLSGGHAAWPWVNVVAAVMLAAGLGALARR